MSRGVARQMRRRKQRVDPDELDDLMTQSEAARLRGVTRAAIGYLIQQGRLRTRELFGRRLVYRSEVEAFTPGKPGPKTKVRKAGARS
jgi:hypothetical protein